MIRYRSLHFHLSPHSLDCGHCLHSLAGDQLMLGGHLQEFVADLQND